MELTPEEQSLFEEVQRTGNLSLFTERYFRLPMSGTWYTPEDRPEQYELLYQSWVTAGKPEDKFSVVLDDERSVEMKTFWDPYYGDYPMILLPHGFMFMPWIERFISPLTSLGVAVTGTGTGKTAMVAIAMLSYCALYPGFRALNVAPTAYQAALMLGEIDKWCAPGSPFRRFIKTTRGAHDLWIERPYPIITIEVWPGFPSTFICQTVGRDASGILGSEQDWINADEAQLLENISVAEPKMTTRMRGTRATGVPRMGKITWITNPGPNPELVALMDKYKDLIVAGEKDVVLLEGIDSSVNIYVTKRQMRQQQRTMSLLDQERWHGGQMSAAMEGLGIDPRLLDACKDDLIEQHATTLGRIDDLGLRWFEMPWEPRRHYIVVGDPGKGSPSSLSTMNVPVVIVFDVTEFLEEGGIKMVALNWIDGDGTYRPFLASLKHMMLKYHAQSYYDAGNVQTAFEDDGSLEGWPTTPVFFGGMVSVKSWAITIFVQLLGDRGFAWPHIKGLWHQCRIFDPGSKKRPDDLLAAVLVLCLAFRYESVFWDKLMDKYDWKEMEDEVPLDHKADTYYATDDRYGRMVD